MMLSTRLSGRDSPSLRWGQELLKKGSLLGSFKGNLFNGPLERPLSKSPWSHLRGRPFLSEVVATALARDAFYLPTYAEVMAEVPTVEVPAPVSSQASGSSPVQPPSKRRCLGEQHVAKSQFGLHSVCLIQARAFFYHPSGSSRGLKGPLGAFQNGP